MKQRQRRVWSAGAMVTAVALVAVIGTVLAGSEKRVKAQDQTTNTGLLRCPDVSGNLVVFTYGGDL